MTADEARKTPLANALTSVIQPKLEEHGWATGGADDAALTEYIVLMIVNKKSQDEVATELSTDLLGLDPDDPGLRDFCNWLFATVDTISAQLAAHDAHNGGAPDVAPGAFDADQDMDMMSTDGPTEINAPTGPKAMRNGSDNRGGRGQRIMSQINQAMNRNHEGILHRTRGNGGINTHSRAPPTGPRAGNNRVPRGGQNRAASIQHGLVNMNVPPQAMNGGMGSMPQWGPMMTGQAPPQNNMMDLLQQQQQMLAFLSQQVLAQNGGNGGRHNGQQRGRGSLMDRSNRGGRGRGAHHNQNGHNAQPSDTTNRDSRGGDVDMEGREAPKPEETVCKYNLACGNNSCKFAHQSPAAPPGVTIDVTDTCNFGIACKNYKCTGRHPSPATKVVHQSEQDCKFFPNCQNPRCTFRHPSKPPCRNGADCKTEGCDFYHTTVMCKFNPCTNRYCTFKHADGQRGTFPDKVWTADSKGQHPSERKFADENAVEEQVLPGVDDAMDGTEHTNVAG